MQWYYPWWLHGTHQGRGDMPDGGHLRFSYCWPKWSLVGRLCLFCDLSSRMPTCPRVVRAWFGWTCVTPILGVSILGRSTYFGTGRPLYSGTTIRTKSAGVRQAPITIRYLRWLCSYAGNVLLVVCGLLATCRMCSYTSYRFAYFADVRRRFWRDAR